MRFIGMSAAVVMAAALAVPAMAQTVIVPAPAGQTVITTTDPAMSSGQAPTTNNSTVYGNSQVGGCAQSNPASCPPGVNPLTQGHGNGGN